MYADSMALLAFASHMLLLLSIACAAIDQYLLPTGPTAARLQHWVCCYGPVCIHRDKRTDRQTDTIPLHRPCSTYYAGSTNNFLAVLEIISVFIFYLW